MILSGSGSKGDGLLPRSPVKSIFLFTPPEEAEPTVNKTIAEPRMCPAFKKVACRSGVKFIGSWYGNPPPKEKGGGNFFRRINFIKLKVRLTGKNAGGIFQHGQGDGSGRFRRINLAAKTLGDYFGDA